MQIVGVVGKSGAGKTTFAQRLVERYGFVEASFADELKRLCCDQFGWDRDALYYDDAARRLGFDSSIAYKEATDPALGKSRRAVLQHIGTEGFRAVDPDHWVRVTLRRLETIDAPGVVLPDVRFLNEIEAVRSRAGVIVEMRRSTGSGTAHAGHASETEWAQSAPDYVFTPAEGVENVRACADALAVALRLESFRPAGFTTYDPAPGVVRFAAEAAESFTIQSSDPVPTAPDWGARAAMSGVDLPQDLWPTPCRECRGSTSGTCPRHPYPSL